MSKHSVDSAFKLSREVFLACVIAGIGMIVAGFFLDAVQTWPAYIKHSQLLIMIPSLLGLKGNLEMTLASRLSTAANMGLLKSSKGFTQIMINNITLTQVQAIALGFFASQLACLFSLLRGTFSLYSMWYVTISAVVTASITSFILGLLMLSVVLAAVRMLNIDPDNVATPIAASLGDFITLGILTITTTFFISNDGFLVLLLISAFYLVLFVALFSFCLKNPYIQADLKQGWIPILSAVAISSLAGLIFREYSYKLKNFALFQPVINGIGGNIVSVYSSRLSTSLHISSKTENKIRQSDGFSMLLFLSIPVHLCMLLFVHYAPTTQFEISAGFGISYCFAAFTQVYMLLLFAQIFVKYLWKLNIDPDNAAIPYATAIGDLLGTLFLTISLTIFSNL